MKIKNKKLTKQAEIEQEENLTKWEFVLNETYTEYRTGYFVVKAETEEEAYEEAEKMRQDGLIDTEWVASDFIGDELELN